VEERHEGKREIYREDKVHKEGEEEEGGGGQERKECYAIYLSLNTQLQCDSQMQVSNEKSSYVASIRYKELYHTGNDSHMA
jgi:hypothetical protein